MTGFQWATNHKLGDSQGGGPRGRAGEDSGSPGTPLLHCGKPMGGMWGWVEVQPGRTGFNWAGLLSLAARASDYVVPPPPCDVAKKLPWMSLGSRARAWPPQPGSVGITCAMSMLLTFYRHKYVLRGRMMQFAGLKLNGKPTFGLAFV